jgi:small ligand-binding sensory domain FIST
MSAAIEARRQTHVAWSTAAEAADAVIDIVGQLLAAGYSREDTRTRTVIAFASHALVRHEPSVRDVLADVLGTTSVILFVGNSAFADLSIRENHAGLVVLVLDDVGGLYREAASDLDGPSMAAVLLADGAVGRMRFLSSRTGAALMRATLLPSLDEQGVPVVGAHTTQEVDDDVPTSVLFLEESRVVVAVSDAVAPIGAFHTVTKCDGAMVLELDGAPALQVLTNDLTRGRREDIGSLKGRLALALASPDDDAPPTLIDVIGLDPPHGGVLTSARFELGSSAAFVIRDSRSARMNLERTLHALKSAVPRGRVRAIAVFTSNMRDERFFDVPLYDVERVLDTFAPLAVPVVGVSSDAVIGAVSASTEAHFSACAIAVFLDDA